RIWRMRTSTNRSASCVSIARACLPRPGREAPVPEAAALVTHRGGCHCGAIAFEVDAPARVTVSECNCSICRMSGYLHLIVPRARLRLLRGPEALDALLDQPAGEVRVVRGALAADTDVLALSAAGADRHRDELAHRLVALVEVARHDGRVAIQPEGELRHVVGADRHAVEMLEEALG